MQIVKLLEDGIAKQDWSKICEAYKSLTGASAPETSTGLVSKGTHDLINLLKENPDLMASIVTMITNIVIENLPTHKPIHAEKLTDDISDIVANKTTLSIDDVITEKDYKVIDENDDIILKETVSDKPNVFGKKTKVISVGISEKAKEEKRRMIERKAQKQSSVNLRKQPVKKQTECVECGKVFEVFHSFEGGNSTLCKKCLKGKKASA
jgi:hypothetical protein